MAKISKSIYENRMAELTTEINNCKDDTKKADLQALLARVNQSFEENKALGLISDSKRGRTITDEKVKKAVDFIESKFEALAKTDEIKKSLAFLKDKEFIGKKNQPCKFVGSCRVYINSIAIKTKESEIEPVEQAS